MPDLLTPELLSAVLRISVPIMLAALGAMISERSGVINIGLDGMMLIGAFAAVYFSFTTGSPFLGMAGAVVAGAVIGAIFAFPAVLLGTNQIVLGAAVNIFAFGITAFMTTVVFQSAGSSARVEGWGAVRIPLLSDIPWLGPILFHQSPTVYVTILLVVFFHVLVFKTRWGVWIRAAGDEPLALHAAGVSVVSVRLWSVVTGGALAGLAGGYLVLEVTRVFSVGMTDGRGFLGLGANIFGNWTPFGGAAGALVFSIGDALRLTSTSLGIPSEILLAFPYILTLIAVVAIAGRARAPRRLGQFYDQRS